MHKFKKQFGQNFLQSQSIIQKIIMAAHLQPDDTVIEIGPGLGSLTKFLLQYLAKLTAIEIDTSLYEKLNALPFASEKLNLIEEDVLKVNFQDFGDNLRIIGNLPYNISTPLIFHLLDFKDIIIDMHFLLQKEVVERLSAKPGSKQYGRLSIMVQYLCDVEHLFNVGPENFFPAPKVDSAFVRLNIYKAPKFEQVDITKLGAVVKQAFAMRRKTIANNLKPIITRENLLKLDIDPGLRPEDISIENYVNIVKSLYK